MRIPCVILMLFATTALAQNKSTTSFLGIEFGKPLPVLQECPKAPSMKGVPITYWPSKATGLCWAHEEHDKTDTFFRYHNVIKGRGDTYDVLGSKMDGDVADIRFWFSAEEGPEFLGILIDKFGNATTSTDEALTTRANVQVTRQVRVWTLDNIEISYSSVADDINRGFIKVSTLAYKQVESDRQKKSAAQAATSF